MHLIALLYNRVKRKELCFRRAAAFKMKNSRLKMCGNVRAGLPYMRQSSNKQERIVVKEVGNRNHQLVEVAIKALLVQVNGRFVGFPAKRHILVQRKNGVEIKLGRCGYGKHRC